MLDSWLSWIFGALMLGTVMMFGSLGEIITEKSGHLNLGVPGIMMFGAFCGFAAEFKYEHSVDVPSEAAMVIIPLLVGFLASAALGLLYAFMTDTLKANQNVTGLAITSFGVGLGCFYGDIVLKAAKVGYGRLEAMDIFTRGLSLEVDFGFMVIVGIVVAIILQLFLSKSRVGLNLRAIGENPATADAAGINVGLYKYLATIFGCGICGIGGAFYVGLFGWTTNNNIESLGWLAVALVIFSTWKPINATWGSILFALLYNFASNFTYLFNVTIPKEMASAVPDLLRMLPYVVTILILILISFRKKKEYQPPAALGLAYFREDR